jgi:hypothetical protein
MRARVLDTWQRLAGVPAPSSLVAALNAALARRAGLDDHHPWLLHPARTALILLDDCAEVTESILEMAVGVDSMVSEWHDRAGPAAAVPVPASPEESERLLERLVAAPRRIRLVACAERLDHARHLHMVPHPAPAEFRAQIESTYLPVAERTEPMLARRLDRWLRARARRGGAGA